MNHGSSPYEPEQQGGAAQLGYQQVAEGAASDRADVVHGQPAEQHRLAVVVGHPLQRAERPLRLATGRVKPGTLR